MKILVTRDTFTLKDTQGILEVFDDAGKLVFSCYTEEDCYRGDGDVKIQDETCIPKGKYLVDINFSNRFKRMLPIIYNHSNDFTIRYNDKVIFSGCRYHSGNTEYDTSGCLLVGSIRNTKGVFNSRETFEKFFGILNAAKRPIPMEIVNQQKV